MACPCDDLTDDWFLCRPFPDYVLEGGKFSLKFYKKVNDGENGQKFVLKTEEEYAAVCWWFLMVVFVTIDANWSLQENNTPVQPSKKYFNYSTLKELIENYPVKKALKPAEVQKGDHHHHHIMTMIAVTRPLLSSRSLPQSWPDHLSCRKRKPQKFPRFPVGSLATWPCQTVVSSPSKTTPIHHWRTLHKPVCTSSTTQEKSATHHWFGPISIPHARWWSHRLSEPFTKGCALHDATTTTTASTASTSSTSIAFGNQSFCPVWIQESRLSTHFPKISTQSTEQTNATTHERITTDATTTPQGATHQVQQHELCQSTDPNNTGRPRSCDEQEEITQFWVSHQFRRWTPFIITFNHPHSPPSTNHIYTVAARAGNPQQKPYKQPNPQQPAKKSPRGPRPRAPSYADQRGGNPSPQR